MDHATLTELAAGAALEDLDPTERAELDRHLGSCHRCRALVHELEDVLGDLALVAPEVRPPAGLRDDVLGRLREVEAGASAPGAAMTLRSVPAQAPRARARRGTWGALALAAALGVVAVGAGARTVQLDAELAAAESALARTEQRTTDAMSAMALIADPTHVTVALHAEPVAPASSAVVVYRPGSTQAYLMATDLPPTPDGSVYQLWVADAGGVHALGTFVHDGAGPVVAPFGVDLGASTAAMVTLEPAGGAVGDPGPEVVFGEL